MSIAHFVPRPRAAVALSLVCAWSAGGCSMSDRFAGEPDAASADGGALGDEDAGLPDAGAVKRGVGAACTAPSECGPGLLCDVEVDRSLTAVDLPAPLDAIAASVFPGGSCTPVLAAAFDGMGGSCDPSMPVGAQGCDNGVCVPVRVLRGDVLETWYACRAACTPGDPDGCGRLGYTCDYVYAACVEGCQSDEECPLRIVDLDDDGQREFQYDATSKAHCDPVTFRCVHDGAGGGETSDPCERLDDCEGDGLCLQHLQGWAGFSWPGGHCTRLGCDVEGGACSGENSVCAPLRASGVATASVCLTRCTVGVEAAGDRLGVRGHGAGCREGYRCHYNGGEGADAGVCVGGNYNAIATSNVGAACSSHDECYSPFGLGQCLSLSVGVVEAPTGVCTIMDCAAPGLPDDLCGARATCLGLSGDRSFCVRECGVADDCAAGFACADDDGVAATPKVCFPGCYADQDCRKGKETCEFPNDPATDMPATVGQCTAT